MHIWKTVFTVLTIVFASAGLLKWLPFDISMPVMCVFMGLSMLANAKEYYDKGARWEAMIFGGGAAFIYVVTVYNTISRIV